MDNLTPAPKAQANQEWDDGILSYVPLPGYKECKMSNCPIAVSHYHSKPTNQEWVKNFDEEFIKDGKPNGCYLNHPMHIKSFIQSLLDQQRSEIVNDIINELESNPNSDGTISPNLQHWIEAKQSQLKSLLKKLGRRKNYLGNTL